MVGTTEETRPSTSPTGAARGFAGDRRWQCDAPLAGIDNFALARDIVHHLAPEGVAGFVHAKGSKSSNHSGEGETEIQAPCGATSSIFLRSEYYV